MAESLAVVGPALETARLDCPTCKRPVGYVRVELRQPGGVRMRQWRMEPHQCGEKLVTDPHDPLLRTRRKR